MSNLITKTRLNYFASKLWENKIKPIKTQLDNHTHPYLPLTGGTVSGSLTVNNGTTTLPNTVLIKSLAEGNTSSITFRDANNETVMYLGRSTGTNNIFRIVNSIQDGDISFGTSGAGSIVYKDGHIKIGSETSGAYRSYEVNRLCSTNTNNLPRKVRYGLNDVEGGVAGIELQENDSLLVSLHLGETFFRPSPSGKIDLGTSSRKWKDSYFSGVVNANGIQLTNTAYPGIKFSNNVRIEYDAANDNLYVAGTKAQSGGLRPFQATICDSTSYAKIAGKKLFIQSGAPSGVATGDVWIQI